MTIGKKLGLAIGSLAILLIFTLIFSFFQVTNIEGKMRDALDNKVNKQHLANEIQIHLGMQGLYLRSYLLTEETEARESFLSSQTLLDEAIEKLKEDEASSSMEEYVKQIDTYNQAFNKAADEALIQLQNGNIDQALVLVNEDATNANNKILEAALLITDYQDQQVEDISEQVTQTIGLTRNIAILILTVAIIVVAVVIVFVNKRITKPLRRIVQATNTIANGDLTIENLNLKAKDELGDLAKSFNIMKENLKGLIQQMSLNATHLSSVAEELSASTEEVSQATMDVSIRVDSTSEGARMSANTAKESALAMDETAVGVQRIAEATQTLFGNANDTRSLANKGEEILTTAKSQMDIIHNSSTETNNLINKLSRQSLEIESITKAITDIAEQTNLLALNAAIEAARAGDHGKGFAVVAEEVKKLAEDSKQSASQIVALTVEIQQDTRNVEKSVTKGLQNVKEGVDVIEEANTSFHTIAKAVEDMSEQIENISAVSEEISASAEEVAASVAEIAEKASEAGAQTEMISAAVEEQAATMQEINSVAQDLTNRAVELDKLVSEFKL